MPASAFIVASLAALDPAQARTERPFAILQTHWSLTASPTVLAAAAQQPPIIGPGQIAPAVPLPPASEDKRREVTVLPAPDKPTDEADAFDALEDPAAAPAAAETVAADAATVETPGDPAAAPADDPAAVDPFEVELSQSIKTTSDPFERFNRISFSVSMFIDRVALRPLALGYRTIAPKPLRDGIRNVLNHWGEPYVFLNDILQLKPKRALRTIGRFLINSLLGIGGLFDVAKDKKFNLPFHGNRFANTLGFYGVKPGPYIYLPLLGPTTIRDYGVEQFNIYNFFIPGFDNPIFRNQRGSVMGYSTMLELRANNDTELKALLDDAVDPYATFRETWMQQRQGEIEDLKAPDGKQPGSVHTTPDSLDDPLIDPAAPKTPAPSPAAPAPQARPAIPATPAP
jgi:phospholipid-binding lipoprotein MlaA